MVYNQNLSQTKAELDRASAGIKKPTITLLKAGIFLYRYASTKNHFTGTAIPSADWANGAWWFGEADHDLIIRRFKEGHLRLGTVARSAGAVQPSWSRMDISIKAELLHDIYVYTGKGAPQYRDELPNGWSFTSKGWPDVDQIYIPGMRTGSRNAIKVKKQKRIGTDEFGF